MKKSLMFIGAVSMLFTAIPVNALTFTSKDKETTYVLEEREIVEACPEETGFQRFVTKAGKLYFGGEDTLIKYVIGDDNKCVEATIEEELEILNREMTNYSVEYYQEIPEGTTSHYNVRVDSYYIRSTGYILTEDTKIDANKTYYYLDGEVFRMVSNPVLDDIATYYETVMMLPPKTVSFDDATLYVNVPSSNPERYSQHYKKLDKKDYDPNKILDYYVAHSAESTKSSKYYPITKEVYDILKSYDSYSVRFVQGTENYYFLGTTSTAMDAYYSTVLDKNGKVIDALSKVDSGYVEILNNGMTIATIDGKTGLYDEDYNLLTVIENFVYPSQFESDGNILRVIGRGADSRDVKIFNLKTYEVLNGDEQDYNGEETLSIRFSGDVKLFKNLYINDKLVDPKNYTVKSGSTIVTFKADYLAELGKGEYTVVAEYTDGGKATASFEIVSLAEGGTDGTKVPATGDVISTYMLLLIVSSAGIYILRKQLKNN